MKFKAMGALAGLALLAACSSGPTANTMNNGQGMTQGNGQGGTEADLKNVGDRVFYGFNSSTLSSEADGILTSQAAWMQKYPSVDVLIAGNCDERGTETYNLALGERRANTARDYLVAQGVSSDRIKTISYGKDCPVASGNDDASYQQNRNAITSVVGYNPQNCH